MPSSIAMVLNSTPQPPAASTTVFTRWPTSCRWTWPGTNWVKLLAMATIGLSKSASVIPVARQSERAPAMLRPCVEVRLRYPVLCMPPLSPTRRGSSSGLSRAPAEPTPAAMNPAPAAGGAFDVDGASNGTLAYFRSTF